MNGNDHITCNSGILLGKPVIKGTRVSVELILKKLSEGMIIEELLDAYPTITRENVMALLSYSASNSHIRKTINNGEGVPVDNQERFNALIAKRQAETLTSDEHDELITLCDQMEALNVERMKALQQLAVIRNTSLAQLMKDLHNSHRQGNS